MSALATRFRRFGAAAVMVYGTAFGLDAVVPVADDLQRHAWSPIAVLLVAVVAATQLWLLPLPWSAFGFLVVVSADFQLAVTAGARPADAAHAMVQVALTGLVLFGSVRLVAVLLERHEARRRLAELALAQERIRVSRDLHDLLGQGLAAMLLKG